MLSSVALNEGKVKLKQMRRNLSHIRSQVNLPCHGVQGNTFRDCVIEEKQTLILAIFQVTETLLDISKFITGCGGVV